MTNRVSFLNTHFDNVGFDDVVRIVGDHVRSGKPGYMVSLNTDIAIQLDVDPDFVKAYNGATLALIDSQPLVWLARRCGIEVREKLSGSDLLPRMCQIAEQNGWSCFIAGGREGVPKEAAKRLKDRFPSLRIAGTLSPAYGFERTEEGIASVTQAICQTHPDLLFLCLGTPKTEKILQPHLAEFGASFTFSVGAAVDFAAGSMHRAPLWMQRCGLEWFYRFCQEPKRLFRRYFVDSWHILRIYQRWVGEARHAHCN